MFLRVYDQKAIENAELSVIPSALTFKRLTNSNFTAEELVSFVDNEMLPMLSRLERCEIEGTYEHAISTFFSLSHNYMKNGILLLQVIELVNEIQSNSFNVLLSYWQRFGETTHRKSNKDIIKSRMTLVIEQSFCFCLLIYDEQIVKYSV